MTKFVSRSFTIMFIVACIFVAGIAVKASESAPRPRFEHIYSEDTRKGEFPTVFHVWHDRESGQEFVCAAGTFRGTPDGTQYHPSCWPTGRNWK